MQALGHIINCMCSFCGSHKFSSIFSLCLIWLLLCHQLVFSGIFLKEAWHAKSWTCGPPISGSLTCLEHSCSYTLSTWISSVHLLVSEKVVSVACQIWCGYLCAKQESLTFGRQLLHYQNFPHWLNYVFKTVCVATIQGHVKHHLAEKLILLHSERLIQVNCSCILVLNQHLFLVGIIY